MFAYTNFDHEPTRAMREEWQAERETLSAARKLVQYDAVRQWWQDRETATLTCKFCGATYESKGTVTRYCSPGCRSKASYRRVRGLPEVPGITRMETLF